MRKRSGRAIRPPVPTSCRMGSPVPSFSRPVPCLPKPRPCPAPSRSCLTNGSDDVMVHFSIGASTTLCPETLVEVAAAAEWKSPRRRNGSDEVLAQGMSKTISPLHLFHASACVRKRVAKNSWQGKIAVAEKTRTPTNKHKNKKKHMDGTGRHMDGTWTARDGTWAGRDGTWTVRDRRGHGRDGTEHGREGAGPALLTCWFGL